MAFLDTELGKGVLVSFFVAMIKRPDKNNKEEEKFIFIPGVRSSVHGWQTP